RESGFDVVFLSRNATIVEHLNRLRRYRVSLSDGHRLRESEIDEVRAVGTFEPERAAREIAGADVVATAVGAGNLPDVAPLIAAGLSRRVTPVNVLAFENMRNASRRLRELVTDRLPRSERDVEHGFAGALVERVV